MAEAMVGVALETLSSLIGKELSLYRGLNTEMKRLESQLTHIKGVLEDAEVKQITNKALKDWLRRLRDEAYLMDDVFDECATHVLSLEYQREAHHYCFCILKPFHFMFRYKMAKKLKDISLRLDGIFAESSRFGLRERVHEEMSSNTDMGWRETTSTISQSHFYGRDAEKQKIVDFLVGDASDLQDLSIYPIVGIGGLGKTTLAQRVYHDERVASHFEQRLWVCVSDDFSMARLLRAIIESAKHTSGYSTLEALHKQVQDLLGRKRYLLVLDDVWNDNKVEWGNFKSVLACGSKGASILLTTRQDNVANITRTVNTLHLSPLSEDDGWEVFRKQAFVSPDEERAELVDIGKEIARKCKGVPLAAKTLGSLLRCNSNEEDWNHIKDSEIWNLPQDMLEEPIIPALRLSYLKLSQKLRRCFAYLAVFPKDEVMSKKHVIELWMANGFISTIEGRDVELDGDRVWNELNSKSFFEDVSSDRSLNQYEEGDMTFKMHDLFHDVAQFVTDKECCSKTSESGPPDERTRHMSIYGGGQDELCSSHCFKHKSLKSLIVRWDRELISSDIFLKCSLLRVLELKCLKEVPSSINQLKHLRYLNLSRGRFTTLPDSICRLWNLLILNLNDCNYLQKLPDQLKCLKSLRHLHLKDCNSLSTMAPKMGQLTHLKTLHTYIVGVMKGFLLEEIENLKLEGTLHIQHLERVTGVMDAKKANLTQKRLNVLQLSWERIKQSQPQESEEGILEVLQPHKQLKKLVIRGYLGAHLPQWMVNPMLNNLSHLELRSCRNVVGISFLAKLPSLKGLELSELDDEVRYIDDECYVEGVERGFQALEELTLEQLQGLVKFSREDGGNMFPRLSTLLITTCPQLQQFPFLPSVTTLKVSSGLSRVLLASIQNLPNLESLDISDDGELTSFPDDMLGGLKNLYIWDFPKLEALPSGLANLNSLQQLSIVHCDSLETITDQVLQGLPSLQSFFICWMPKLKLCEGVRHLIALEHLAIDGCPKVEDLHDALQHLTSLETLQLEDLPNLASLPHCLGNLSLLRALFLNNCHKLKSLPISIQSLSNLNWLRIRRCPELAKRCKEGTGEDWHKISHVPCLDIMD